MVAILGMARDQILGAVRQMYTDVAASPSKQFHFPTGRSACLFVGYPDDRIEMVPDAAVESFAGVGFPFRADVIRPRDSVLDIGAGSGTDAIIAARLAGPDGKVFALDMTLAMLDKLRRNVVLAGTRNVEAIEGNAETIPLPDASVDVVTSNGVLNLVPDKPKAVAEIFRVLRPGGWVQIADIVVSRPVGEKSRGDPKLWAECVVGASLDEDYLDLFRARGFIDVRVLRRFDYFSGSASPDTRRIAGALGGRAVEIKMCKPTMSRSVLSMWMERLRPTVLARRIGQRGAAMGLFGTIGAVAACYGVLALVGAFGLLGLSMPLNDGLWAAMIAGFAVLALVGLGRNLRVHSHWRPAALGAAAVLAVLYALLGSYDWRIEAGGFTALFGAALWDRRLLRRALDC